MLGTINYFAFCFTNPLPDWHFVLIIFRYLSRQILVSTLAVTAVLTLVIVSGRLIKFLTYAAAGELSPEFVLQSVAYRVPGMLMLILPLGLFLGVLLAYGRMYLESEMVVLQAGGVSPKRLTGYALGAAFGVAVLVAFLGMYGSPYAWKQMDILYQKQSEASELDMLSAGRFQNFSGSHRTIYTSGAESSDALGLIFVSESDEKTGQISVVMADSGRKVDEQNSDLRYIVLEDGVRYEGVPGQANYQAISFDEYGFQLPPSNLRRRSADVNALTITELLAVDSVKHKAEIQWLLSLPFLVLIITMIAVPMAKTNPRQGRYAKLVPSILLYMLYLTLLTSAKGKMEDGDLPLFTLWLIHAAFLSLALSMLFAGHFWENFMNRLPSMPSFKRSKS